MKKNLFVLLIALMAIFGLAVSANAAQIENSNSTIKHTRNEGPTLYETDGRMTWWADPHQMSYNTEQKKKSGIHSGKQIQGHDDWIPIKRQKQLEYGDRHSSNGYYRWSDTGLIEPILWSESQILKLIGKKRLIY